MKEQIVALCRRFRMLLSYFSHSVICTAVDVALVWILLKTTALPLVAANTVGVITGFILGFFLDVRLTFLSRYSPLTFAVYLGTFLLGLALADWLILRTYELVRPSVSESLAFLIGKGASVVIPFFALYFLRKFLYGLVRRREEKKQK